MGPETTKGRRRVRSLRRPMVSVSGGARAYVIVAGALTVNTTPCASVTVVAPVVAAVKSGLIIVVVP